MNKLLSQALGINQASTKAGDGGRFTIVTATGRHVGVLDVNPDPADPENEKDLALVSWNALAAIRALAVFDKTSSELQRDQRLSAYGRKQALLPNSKETATAIAAAWANLNLIGAALEKQEAARYAWPLLGVNDVVGELRDREVRERLHAIGPDAQTKALTPRAGTDPNAVILAILRSPTSFGALEQAARNMWISAIDTNDPEGLARLTLEKNALSWAISVVRMVAAAVNVDLGFEPAELYDLTKQYAPARLWGFSANQVVLFERSSNSAGAKTSAQAA